MVDILRVQIHSFVSVVITEMKRLLKRQLIGYILMVNDSRHIFKIFGLNLQPDLQYGYQFLVEHLNWPHYDNQHNRRHQNKENDRTGYIFKLIILTIHFWQFNMFGR